MRVIIECTQAEKEDICRYNAVRICQAFEEYISCKRPEGKTCSECVEGFAEWRILPDAGEKEGAGNGNT